MRYTNLAPLDQDRLGIVVLFHRNSLHQFVYL
jgi:hypothetical protein